jgi:hypothetical protein
MGMASLERGVLREAREAFRNPKLKLADLREWSSRQTTVEGNLQADEVMLQTRSGFWVAIYKTHDKRIAEAGK